MEHKELTIGTNLQSGKYTIERIIGAGGFGITYYARHNGLGHYFAIKEFFISSYCMLNSLKKTVMLQGIDPAIYEKYRQKFIEEAQILVRIDHPNIVKVTDIFEENNTAYIVMPFIEGQTLQQLVSQKGRLDYETAVNYIAQLSEAVDYIHQRDILHRDIKPDNIIITPADKAILIDFGSAREFIHDKTQQHTSIFTQGYAPLEQYSTSSKKGSYSDIYSLGATFYFALTGQKPMDAATHTMETMPEPKALVSSIPDEANRTIMKAMSSKPDYRQQRISEFMDDLLNTEKNPTISKERIRIKHQKKSSNSFSKYILIIAITFICIVTGALLFDWYNKKQEQLAREERVRQEQLARDERIRQEQLDREERLRQERLAEERKQKEERERIAQEQERIHNSLNIEMVFVQGGTFTMGCTSEQEGDCLYDEKPAHRVTVSDYYIGKYEVTQAQWRAVIGNNPSNFKGENLPVETVSWNDVQEFIRRLNASSGKQYRLPTEAEWEFAARGGNSSRGNKYSGSNTVGNIAWYDENSGSSTHPVGTKSSNELGIYDMSGNVCEWCYDWYGNYSNNAQTNPQGPTSGSGCVGRGGSWGDVAGDARVSYRGASTPGNRYINVGFRLACSSK